MVDESDIRFHLVDDETPAIAIDTDAIISRSKARRKPRQFAVVAVSVLAGASLVFAGISTFPHTGGLTTAGSTAEESSTRMDGDTGPDAADSYLAPDTVGDTETCGAIIPDQPASPYGLALELDLPGPVTASGSAFGTVRLTNTSNVAVTGTTASVPDVNLTRESVSISHSPDAQILSVIPVNLQPGQSIEFAISLAIYDCTTIDTGGTVDPGIYTASTSLAFVPSDPEVGEAVEVRSPPSTIVLQ